MALQDILDKIDQETSDKISKLKKEYAAKQAKLEEEYKEKVEAEIEKIKKTGEEKAAKIKEKAAILGKMEAKNALLSTKRKAIKKAHNELLKNLVGSDEYTSYITQLFKKLASEYKEGTVISAKGKKDQTADALRQSGTGYNLSENEGEFTGGFILQSGKIEVDCSFESLLDKQLKDELEEKFVDTLFN